MSQRWILDPFDGNRVQSSLEQHGVLCHRPIMEYGWPLKKTPSELVPGGMDIDGRRLQQQVEGSIDLGKLPIHFPDGFYNGAATQAIVVLWPDSGVRPCKGEEGLLQRAAQSAAEQTEHGREHLAGSRIAIDGTNLKSDQVTADSFGLARQHQRLHVRWTNTALVVQANLGRLLEDLNPFQRPGQLVDSTLWRNVPGRRNPERRFRRNRLTAFRTNWLGESFVRGSPQLKNEKTAKMCRQCLGQSSHQGGQRSRRAAAGRSYKDSGFRIDQLFGAQVLPRR